MPRWDRFARLHTAFRAVRTAQERTAASAVTAKLDGDRQHDEPHTEQPVLKVTEAAALPYHLQGDASFDTKDARRRREQLRHAPRVLEALEVWWATATHSGLALTVASGDALSKTQYQVMSTKMYRAMVAEYVAEDARAVADEEWENDAAGGVALDREAFMDSIFEVADLWTATIDEDECAPAVSAHAHALLLRRLCPHSLLAARRPCVYCVWC